VGLCSHHHFSQHQLSKILDLMPVKNKLRTYFKEFSIKKHSPKEYKIEK